MMFVNELFPAIQMNNQVNYGCLLIRDKHLKFPNDFI